MNPATLLAVGLAVRTNIDAKPSSQVTETAKAPKARTSIRYLSGIAAVATGCTLLILSLVAPIQGHDDASHPATVARVSCDATDRHLEPEPTPDSIVCYIPKP